MVCLDWNSHENPTLLFNNLLGKYASRTLMSWVMPFSICGAEHVSTQKQTFLELNRG